MVFVFGVLIGVLGVLVGVLGVLVGVLGVLVGVLGVLVAVLGVLVGIFFLLEWCKWCFGLHILLIGMAHLVFWLPYLEYLISGWRI